MAHYHRHHGSCGGSHRDRTPLSINVASHLSMVILHGGYNKNFHVEVAAGVHACTLRLDHVKDGRAGRIVVAPAKTDGRFHGCHVTFDCDGDNEIFGVNDFHIARPIALDYYESKKSIFLGQPTSEESMASKLVSIGTVSGVPTITLSPALPTLRIGTVISQGGYPLALVQEDHPSGGTSFGVDLLDTVGADGSTLSFVVTPPENTSPKQGWWVSAAHSEFGN